MSGRHLIDFVAGAGAFAAFDETAPPPAMPDWSPVRRFGGYAAWGDFGGSGQAVDGIFPASIVIACASRTAARCERA